MSMHNEMLNLVDEAERRIGKEAHSIMDGAHWIVTCTIGKVAGTFNYRFQRDSEIAALVHYDGNVCMLEGYSGRTRKDAKFISWVCELFEIERRFVCVGNTIVELTRRGAGLL